MLMMLEAWWYRGNDKPTDADEARHLGKRPAELTLMAAKASRADAHDAQGFSVPWEVGASWQGKAQ